MNIQNNLFPANHYNFAFLLILLLKIVDLKKKSVQFAMIFYWLFKIYRKLNIQNDGLHWLIRSQNFDFFFQIAITFQFYIRF